MFNYNGTFMISEIVKIIFYTLLGQRLCYQHIKLRKSNYTLKNPLNGAVAHLLPPIWRPRSAKWAPLRHPTGATLAPDRRHIGAPPAPPGRQCGAPEAPNGRQMCVKGEYIIQN